MNKNALTRSLKFTTLFAALLLSITQTAAAAEVKIVPKKDDEGGFSFSIQSQEKQDQESDGKTPVAQTKESDESSGRDQAIVVLDGSGSMWGVIDDVTKIEIARDVVGNVLLDWPEHIDLGLMSYGHREKGNCEDIETLITPQAVDADEFRNVIGGIQPKGKTPMSQAVILAAQSLRHTENKATVILISDGIETCGLDPCAVGRELEAAGVDFTTHVIGFAVADDSTDGLRCLAEETGGQFLRAANADELKKSFQESVATVTAPPSAEPAPTKNSTLGSLSVVNLTESSVELCLVSSECYNRTSEGWVGKLTPDQSTMNVLPGDYQLKLGSLHYAPITVEGGERTEVVLGRVEVKNIRDGKLQLCSANSECYNRTSEGWVGKLSIKQPFLEVPEGEYRLKHGSHSSAVIVVNAGDTTTLELGTITLSEFRGEDIAVCAAQSECYNRTSDGWVGKLSAKAPKMEVFAGNYQLKFGSHLSDPVSIEEGENVNYWVGKIGVDELGQQKVAVCTAASECYNRTSDGWVGKLDQKRSELIVPPGSYKLKIGKSFSDPIEVSPEPQPEASHTKSGSDTASATPSTPAVVVDDSSETFRDCDNCPALVVLPETVTDGHSQSQYAIGKFEVTRAQFSFFVDATNHQTGPCDLADSKKFAALVRDILSDKDVDANAFKENDTGWANPGFAQDDSHPVVCVNLEDAIAYVDWLSIHTGETYRLPTETLWAQSAYAGSTTLFEWGDDLEPNRANCNDDCADGFSYTAPSGSFAPNAYGLYDVHGNVYEWLDNFSSTGERPGKDGRYATIRGGSYRSGTLFLQAKESAEIGYEARNKGIGFRVARSM